MSPRTATQQKWILASLALTGAYADLILSRQAITMLTRGASGPYFEWGDMTYQTIYAGRLSVIKISEVFETSEICFLHQQFQPMEIRSSDL